MRFRALGAAIVLGLMVGVLSVTTASAASIVVAPTSVPVGGTVTVSGDVLGPRGTACVAPGQVTLISGAFAGQGSFQNQDVETTADGNCRFSTKATILSGVQPGTYSITGRYGGGNLGVQATLAVTPPTISPKPPSSPSVSPKQPASPSISPKQPASPTISPKPLPSPTTALPLRISVPDVRNMSRDRACGTLRDAGLSCSGGGSAGQVTAQSPAPGTLVDDGTLVALEVQAPGQEFAMPGWVIPVALALVVGGGAAVQQYRRRHPPPPARIDVRLRPGSPHVRADETREW